MWDYEPDEVYERRVKRYGKDHPRELQAVLTNLDILQKGLQAGMNPQKLPYGFIHPEQRGVVSIDQTGGTKKLAGQKGGRSLAQARLYVYLDRDAEMIHLVTLGDKNSQKADVKYASEFVERLKEQKEKDEPHG